MKLISAYEHGRGTRLDLLFDLLTERDDNANISHRYMPTFEQHRAFVESRPYEAWYFIHNNDGLTDGVRGTCYLTHQNEIGVQIFKTRQGKGYGKEAVQALMSLHGPRRYLANVNPANERSAKMFQGLGFKLVQHTLALEPST